jgi:hypothetical protein
MVQAIGAGGDCSFASVRRVSDSGMESVDHRTLAPFSSIETLTMPVVDQVKDVVD